MRNRGKSAAAELSSCAEHYSKFWCLCLLKSISLMRRKYKYRVDFCFTNSNSVSRSAAVCSDCFHKEEVTSLGTSRKRDLLGYHVLEPIQNRTKFVRVFLTNISSALMPFCAALSSRLTCQEIGHKFLCFSKTKIFRDTDAAGDEQAPTLAWAIFELPLTYPT